MADPKEIRFSQDSIRSTFKNGKDVDEVAEQLRNGELDPTDFPPVRLVEDADSVFTLDNRRLEAFRRAEKDIPFEKLDSIPKDQQFKFTTMNQGESVRVRQAKPTSSSQD